VTTDAIAIRDLAVLFGATNVLDGFDLDVPLGSLVAIVGPSGCGKTTALRSIAGFQTIDSGTITIRERVVADSSVSVAPEKRRVGMVFQEFALFPHISVGENVGYGVRGADRIDRVTETLRLVGLSGYEDRFPHELSGGEQQRVALARALAPQPDVVLLDEPFSNLDAPQRERMRRELKRIIRTAGVTALFVTHDQAEALAIADHIAVMRNGRIVQAGSPDDVYAHPVSPWVATFLGDAALFDGVATEGVVETTVGDIPTDLADGTPVKVMVRPEWVQPRREDAGTGRIADREFYGHDQRVEIELESGSTVEALVPGRANLSVGDQVSIDVLDAIVYPDADIEASAIPSSV
jgi:iron(III) transport system ATP-binding protein